MLFRAPVWSLPKDVETRTEINTEQSSVFTMFCYLVTVSLEKNVLEWKFYYYDRDGNDGLTPGEQYLSQEEIHGFLSCSSFYGHIIELIDVNHDKEIDITEWGAFFEGTQTA